MKLLAGILIVSFICNSLYSIDEQVTVDSSVDVRKKAELPSPSTVGQKLQAFLQEHAFALISLACTIASLYMSYYFSNETLKLSRASFLLNKGDAALKNIWMVRAGLYEKYKALAQGTKGCA